MMLARREPGRSKMPDVMSSMSKPLVLVVEDEAALVTMLRYNKVPLGQHHRCSHRSGLMPLCGVYSPNDPPL